LERIAPEYKDAGTRPVAQTIQWKAFVEQLPAQSRLSELLIEPWTPRSPEDTRSTALAVRAVGPEALTQRLADNQDLLTVATPHLGWLTTMLANIRHVVFLTDREGVVLHSSGNDTQRMSDFGLFPGYDWSEDAMGPNGAGTAIRCNRPVTLVGPEHAPTPLEDCTCTGAPLHAPDGTVLGAIAVNASVQDGTPERLVLVAHTAFVIDRELVHSRSVRRPEVAMLPHTTIRLLTDSGTVEEGAGRVLNALCEGLRVAWGALWRADDATGRLRVAHCWHTPRAPAGAFDGLIQATREATCAAGSGWPGRAAASGQAVWVSSLEAELGHRAAAARAVGIGHGVAVPVCNGSRGALAVIELLDGDALAPQPELVSALETVAGELALFLQRRAAEGALELSAREHRVLAEAVPGVLFTASPQGECEYYSPQWYAYTGVQPGSLSEGWEELIHPDDLEAVKAGWQRAIERGGLYTSEHRIRAQDGVYRWFAARARPLRDEQGRIVRWCGAAIEIDRQKNAEMALREADRRKNEFLGMLAHELRNPLAPIRNAIHLLGATGTSEELVRKATEVAERQFAHIARLVDDLLDVSRISEGKIRLQKERLDLAAVAASAAEAARPLLAEKEQAFSIDLPDAPLWVEGDRTRLEQIVGNLLHNACKFSASGGHVALALTREGDNALLSVDDDGVGIAHEALPHVFELFFQADTSLDRAQGGLGIGLTLARRLIEVHGGTIQVSSDGPGKGSRFAFRLPLAAVASGTAASESSTAARGGPPLRILLIEDNADAAETTAMMMRLWGHEVTVARDGEEALALAESFGAHIVLLDLGLPKIDGYEVARRLRASPRLKPPYIVALSGYSSTEDREAAQRAGVDYHLVKPVAPAALENLLAGYAARGGEGRPAG
jgi:PAS domain S-box-containing protein